MYYKNIEMYKNKYQFRAQDSYINLIIVKIDCQDLYIVPQI